MGDYFHNWKRKLGVVTLLVTCVFMGGWVRSLLVEDYFTLRDWIDLPVDDFVISGLGTRPHFLQLMRQTPPPIAPGPPEIATPIEIEVEPVDTNDSDACELDENRQWGGSASFGVQFCCLFSTDETFAEIPFWSIVAPWTLLSAWLLLSPRKTGKTLHTN